MDYESADPVIFIVRKLNEHFKLKLTLVDFDEKSPTELLQTLNDVLAALEPSLACDVRDGHNMQQFLHMLKFPIGDLNGEKQTIYPILHWLFEKWDVHKKRAYLGKFLYPVEMPQEFLQDEVVATLYHKYKELQSHFKRVHQRVDSHEPTSDLRAEIGTLDDEKKQLEAKIERLAKQNDSPEFTKLLEATNLLRVQQDEELRLQETMKKQKLALRTAETKKKEALKRLNNKGDLFEQLSSQVETLKTRLKELPVELQAKKARLKWRLEAEVKTKDDVAEVRLRISDMEARIQNVKERIKVDPKMATYKQQANLVARRLADQEALLEREEENLQRAHNELDSKEVLIPQMSHVEFKKFGQQLRDKTREYKQLKTHLDSLQKEAVILGRTEHLLRSRVANLELFLTELEARQGVSGYRATKSKLEDTAEKTSETDRQKAETLEDISETVRQISKELKEKKQHLAPQIKQLKEVRDTFRSVEAEYLAKKANYDKVAVGLELDRHQLESDCDAYQDEALSEESKFHYLNCLTALAEETLQRLDDEAMWKSSSKSLLPNFKSYEDLYNNKLAQQQAFSDQLRKQKAAIEKNEGPSTRQRFKFVDLDKLLAAKLNASLSFEDNGGFRVGTANVYQLTTH